VHSSFSILELPSFYTCSIVFQYIYCLTVKWSINHCKLAAYFWEWTKLFFFSRVIERNHVMLSIFTFLFLEANVSIS
jgi:hypothetical protein